MTTKLLSNEKRESLEQLVTLCQENLDDARAYLAERGFTRRQDAEHFRLGVVGANAPRALQYLRGWLTIPYLDRRGPAYIRYRCMQNHDCKTIHGGKYDAEPVRRAPLFNARAFFTKSPVICVAEGEFDAMVMDRLVGVPAVALAGAHAWRVGARETPDFRVGLFDDYQRVFIIGDGDTEGDKMARLVYEDLIFNGEIVRWDRGEDINSVFLTEGRRGIIERLGLDVSEEKDEEQGR